MGSPPSPSIISQISCDVSEHRTSEFIDISVEVSGYLELRVEATERRLLSVKGVPGEREEEWKAN